MSLHSERISIQTHMEGKKRSVENTPLDKTSRFEAISDLQTRLGNIFPKDIIFIDQGLY